MDWLLWLFMTFAHLPFIIPGREQCYIDDCSKEYTMSMATNNIEAAEPTPEYCEILTIYQKCLRTHGNRCRGNMLYQATERIVRQLVKQHCSSKSGRAAPKAAKNESVEERLTTPDYPVPSCRFAGRNVFKHCGFFGDPHLKTFDSKFQTCRVLGEWYLIDNPYMSVALTNEFVAENEIVTAPTKIVIVIKSRSTPCTLEKRYEADSREERLPSTFVDGTDRPGADETVSLKFTRDDRDNAEKVEIYMKYIASKLVVRRVGKYLAFSARLPEEVIKSSSTYDDEDAARKTELCTVGCPVEELLTNIQQQSTMARRYKMDRARALKECSNVEVPGYHDLGNNLTGTFLDWCVFDLMSAGLSYDFVAIAHVAQTDAFSMDPSASLNGTEEKSLFALSDTEPSSAGSVHLLSYELFRVLLVTQGLLLAVSSYLINCPPLVTWWLSHTPMRQQPPC